jgi:hypothetical protein
LPQDRAKQEKYYPTHLAKAQPPHHQRDINRPLSNYHEIRLSIAHEDLPHQTGQRKEDHVSDSTTQVEYSEIKRKSLARRDALLPGTAWESASKPLTQSVIGSEEENPKSMS